VEEMAAMEEIAPVSPPEPEPTPVNEPEGVSTPSAIPDWLQKLRQVDEEEIAPLPAIPVPLPAPAAVAKPVYAQAGVVPPPDIPVDADERLKRARTARDKGDINEAVGIYDSLVVSGVYLNKIIEDIQQTIKMHPDNYLLYQLMGDAMMRDGRLQSALNAYREALSKLS
jgi:tetratricopeptide (TPR) repeat protein